MVTQEEMQNMTPEQIAELQKQNCIFCHIISGRVKSKKVYEDDKVTAILDINPANPGHILLLPKKHYMIMPQMPEDEIGHIFMVAKSLSNALLKALKAKGTNIYVANGAAAGQKAPHFMLNIIPRHANDGLNLVLPEHDMPEQQLEEIHKTLLAKIKELFSLSDADMEKLGPMPEKKEQEAVARESDSAKAEDTKDTEEVAKEDDNAKTEDNADDAGEEETKDNAGNNGDIDFDELKKVLEKDGM